MFSFLHEVQIMNCVHRMTSTILLILLGIQAVSHSQYYSSRDHESFRYPMSSVTSIKAPDNPTSFFSTRNYQPPYRQHQHSYHYSNDPFGPTATTVKYYGTGSHQQSPQIVMIQTTEGDEDVDIFRPQDMESLYYRSSPYRIRSRNMPVVPFSEEISPQPNRYNSHGIETTFQESEAPTYRHPQSRNYPFRHLERNPDTNMVERPPVAIVMVIYRPNRLTCQKPQERIHRNDSTCYTMGTTGPCHQNSGMIFYGEIGNDVYGHCDCASNDGKAIRPHVLWRDNNQCYPLYDRGPCGYNAWLVIDSNGVPRCAPRKCAQDFNEGDQNNEFWFLHEGKCYKTGEHFPKFCDIGKENWKVWFGLDENAKELVPMCLKNRPDPIGRTLISSVRELRCPPGYKKVQNGDCKRIARFDNDY